MIDLDVTKTTSTLAAEARNLNIRYGKFLAVKNVALQIESKKITAIIGPSGCGKSTVLRTFNRMNDFIKSARIDGEVLFHGQNLYDPIGRSGSGAQADRHGLPKTKPFPEIDL